jgi:5-methylcytosine-specific restriction endonuclease McrA
MRALVFNTDYSYISITPHWLHSLRLVTRGRVTPLEVYEKKIRSEHEVFEVPAVIILKNYARIHRKRQSFTLPTHKNILIREDFKCAYCGAKITLRTCTKDHIIPRSKGGKDELLNVVAACVKCNGIKADKSLADSGLTLRVQPRQLTDDEKLSVIMKTHDGIERKTWLNYLKKSGLTLF